MIPFSRVFLTKSTVLNRCLFEQTRFSSNIFITKSGDKRMEVDGEKVT